MTGKRGSGDKTEESAKTTQIQRYGKESTAMEFTLHTWQGNHYLGHYEKNAK
jgi:hypothetical protein